MAYGPPTLHRSTLNRNQRHCLSIAGPIFWSHKSSVLILATYTPLHILPCLTLHIQLDVAPLRRIPMLAWEECEAERRKEGAASPKIKRSEQIGDEKTLGGSCVDFSFPSMFPSPKDPDVGKKMMPQMSILMKCSLELGWTLCMSHCPQTRGLKSRPG